jgi:ribosomal protein L30E
MAKKKAILSEELRELRMSLQEGKVIAGADRVLKILRAGKTAKVYLASNCPVTVLSDIESLCKVVECNLVKLDLNNEELGVFCKKNFFISVLCIEE